MVSTRTLRLFGAALIGLAFFSTTAQAQKTEAAGKLPDPVRKAFHAKFPRGEILKVDAEEENGVNVYDIEFKDGNVEKEMDIAADGTVIEITTVVEPRLVPQAVLYAISHAAPDGKFRRIERVEASYQTKEGKTVKLAKPAICFEVEVTKGKQVAEIVIAPDGKVLKPAKWSEEKAKKPEKPETAQKK
jgi:uncharacterized membrane protein YkoI